ncbi:hypothetical protein G7Z17_g8205 [Cylindrodendrum hubeiense]|uniref:Uncharacterized protein n=1 Tax=Cylindrodendrum hubeiense TaxID=595255 RepID=A0A9P5H1M7_9HYPO|nr:hypothetical protein G7Z17_g8205 [Cylindrodendrum hubeiense]
MPGPPTPVSGCPLQRLEIREGASSRVYHTCRPRNVFTLTLEGERPVESKAGTLILLIFNGQQRMVSVRLHDLLKSPLGSTDIVSVEKQRNQLCIKIPGENSAIVAQFEEKRDFNLAVYMLEKSNLHINEPMTRAPTTSIVTALPTTSLNLQTASNFGPRLSSITPLPQSFPSNVPYGLDHQSDTPFTSMLNSPLPPEGSGSTWGQPTAAPQFQYPQRINSLPTYASASPYSPLKSEAIGQQLNPYNIFLSRSNSQVHMPRSGTLDRSLGPELSGSHANASNASFWLLFNRFRVNKPDIITKDGITTEADLITKNYIATEDEILLKDDGNIEEGIITKDNSPTDFNNATKERSRCCTVISETKP